MRTDFTSVPPAPPRFEFFKQEVVVARVPVNGSILFAEAVGWRRGFSPYWLGLMRSLLSHY